MPVEQSSKEQTLESWMRTYGTDILRICFVILSDACEAEDAMQDTFLRAWRAMDNFKERNASPKTWLIRIAINICRNYRRRCWFRHIGQHVEGRCPSDGCVRRSEHDLSGAGRQHGRPADRNDRRTIRLDRGVFSRTCLFLPSIMRT